MNNEHEFSDVYTDEDSERLEICSIQKDSQSIESIRGYIDKDKFEEGGLQKIINDFYSLDKLNQERIITKDYNPNNPKNFLKSLVTDFIIEDVTMNESTDKLIYLLNKIFDGFFAEYERRYGERYLLLFKGGNIYKLYFENYIDEYFNDKLKYEIYSKYGKYFKYSDLDFQVISENDISESKQYELLAYLWYILLIVRVCILSNTGNIYKFCKLNIFSFEKETEELLLKINEEVSKSEFEEFNNLKFIGISFNNDTVYTKHNEEYFRRLSSNNFIDVFDNYKVSKFFKTNSTTRHDTIVISEEDKLNVFTIKHERYNLFVDDLLKRDFYEVYDDVLPNESSEFFITVNPKIQVDEVKFKLARLMINFALIYEKDNKFGSISVPSELYDITVSNHKEDVKKHLSYNLYIYESEGIKDQIVIPSLFYVRSDLIRILFEQYPFPWDDRKYLKRFIRLIFVTRYIESKYLNKYEYIYDENYKDKSEYTTQNLLMRLHSLERKLRDDEDRNQYDKMLETFLETNQDINDYHSKKIKNRTNNRIREFKF